LRKCALGYRARNLLATARLVASGEANLERWSSLPDDALRARLCELPGVGGKVANCVMLFAYERLRAFPIDVWIERVLKEKYFPRKRKVTAQQLRAFCETYFGEHGGYAQQYLFHHARKGGGGKVVRPGDLRYDSPARNR
jgi:N-glycosylase/DNA lyase